MHVLKIVSMSKGSRGTTPPLLCPLYASVYNYLLGLSARALTIILKKIGSAKY